MAKSTRLQASPLWMLLSIAAFVASAVLALLPILRIISNTSPITSLAGWLLTPVATFVFFGIDNQRQNSNGSRNFIMKPGYSLTLKIVAFASIALLVPHVWRLAQLWSVVNN